MVVVNAIEQNTASILAFDIQCHELCDVYITADLRY